MTKEHYITDEDIKNMLNEENWLVENAYNAAFVMRFSEINFFGCEPTGYNLTVAKTIEILKERLDLANKQIDELVEILECESIDR